MMPGRDNSFEALAREAAERLSQARDQGEQLVLFAERDGAAVAQGEGDEADRRTRETQC